MSYVMEEGDSVEGLSSRFGVSMDSIETANGMDGPDEVVVGDVYYIPLNSGEAFGIFRKFEENLRFSMMRQFLRFWNWVSWVIGF